MKKKWFGFAAVGSIVSMGAGGSMLAGCGDDTVMAAPHSGTDGSVSFDAPAYEAGNGEASEESDAAADAGDAGEAQAPTPSRLLLSYNGTSQSELVAFGLQSGAIDGVYVYPGFIGTSFVTPNSPWLLEQSNDVVDRLEPLSPWQVRSSWNVGLNDYAADAGFSSPYSDPDAIVVGTGTGTKVYVLRYTRNLVAVLDSSQVVDGGAPVKTIDLSSQVQANGDGYVEMTAGYYDSSTQRVYVLLANIDRFNVASDGYTLLCSATTPTLVAIDTTSDTLVDLNPDGGTMGWTLPGYNPVFGTASMIYDLPNNRLLVLQAGCNAPGGDGGAGPLMQREIDAISLGTGAAQRLVDLTTAAFPVGLYSLDAQHAVVQLDTAYTWDPSSSTLGPAIPNAPLAFSPDGKGNLVGVTQPVAPDGGIGPWTVVSVNVADGGVTTLGTDPFPADDAGGVGPGFVSGAQLWPAR